MKNSKWIRQFCSYFVVGGIAALVEWISFGISNQIINVHYLIATVISFILATFVNWCLGRMFTFHDSCKKWGIWKDLLSVYLVSLFGLFLNVILMIVFVQGVHLHTMVSKITATGIVFIWNFLIRKLCIYKS